MKFDADLSLLGGMMIREIWVVKIIDLLAMMNTHEGGE